MISFLPDKLWPQDIPSDHRFIHNLGIELRPAYIIPSTSFFDGANSLHKPIRNSFSGHLKYSFHLPTGSVYSDTYQGIGISHFDFGNSVELGSPTAIYLFQRSKIARLSSRISLDYEWNFGLSSGWKPYNSETNPNNVVIGSRINAYINTGVYLQWKLGRGINLATGVDVSHFSNGNTNFPNAGLNATGLKMGIQYDLENHEGIDKGKADSLAPKFPRHVSYDLVVFGSWRRKGVDFMDEPVPSPYKYPVVGAYFAPMYNFNYRVRAGFSVDAIYDGSANVYTEDYIQGTTQEFFKPPIDYQIAFGLSGRAEYVMPIFTISMGIGSNILDKGGDLSGTYQTLALKVRVTRNSFLHIGYNLKDFQEPNFLMLGLGWRFNNRAPSLL